MGKTNQLIALVVANTIEAPTLVVAMVNNCTHWANEFIQFGGIHAFIPPKKLEGNFSIGPDTKVVIIPYSMVKQMVQMNIEWGRLIIDEGHTAQNPKTAIHKVSRFIGFVD